MARRVLAVIGGTGIDQLVGVQILREHQLETPFGNPSRAVQEGRAGEARLFFLQRHGAPAAIPPHLINYRANLWALHSLGVSDVVAVNTVGGISADMPPGTLVVPDQIIDYTWGREHSFDDGASGHLMHVDFTDPYDRSLREALIQAAGGSGISYRPGGVYGATQGPRLETAAEIARMARDGCDVVGMTGMPEAGLARELGLAYASVCMVVNPAAGLSDLPITLESMRDTLQRAGNQVTRLLDRLLADRYSG